MCDSQLAVIMCTIYFLYWNIFTCKVLKAETDTKYKESLEPLLDVADMAGCLPLCQHVIDKELLVRSICHFQLVDRVTMAIDQ